MSPVLVGELVTLVKGPEEAASAVSGYRWRKSWQSWSLSHITPQQYSDELAAAAVIVPDDVVSVVVQHLLVMVSAVPLACGTGVRDRDVDSAEAVVAGELTAGKLFVYESGIGISIVVPEKMYVAVDT